MCWCISFLKLMWICLPFSLLVCWCIGYLVMMNWCGFSYFWYHEAAFVLSTGVLIICLSLPCLPQGLRLALTLSKYCQSLSGTWSFQGYLASLLPWNPDFISMLSSDLMPWLRDNGPWPEIEEDVAYLIFVEWTYIIVFTSDWLTSPEKLRIWP